MGIVNAWNALWEPNPRAIKPRRKREYAGAEVSRLTSGWVTSTNSADSDNKGSLKKLRNRSRQLTRDVDYCRNAIRAITDNVVGTGIAVLSVTWAALPFAMLISYMGFQVNKSINNE